MKQQALNIAFAKKRAEVSAKKDEQDRKVALILSIPEINEAHANYVSARFANALGGQDAEEKSARAAYVSALKKHGYSEQDMQASPVCPICDDLGRIDGRLCKCVWTKYIAALKDVCEINARARYTFADADFDVAKDGTQREILKKLFSFGKAWADKLPAVKTKTLTFFGNAGTGKTFLASAIARETIERGKSVKYVSAYEFNSAMLSAHTSPLTERDFKLHDYLICDLLVIDDLGTEPILKNVTVEYLLLVLEERMRKGLCTLISTNLSPARLLDRYGERIYSRLAGKQTSRILEFVGKDLRLH